MCMYTTKSDHIHSPSPTSSSLHVVLTCLPPTCVTFNSPQSSLSAVYMCVDVGPCAWTWETYQWSHAQKWMVFPEPAITHCQHLLSNNGVWISYSIICLNGRLSGEAVQWEAGLCNEQHPFCSGMWPISRGIWHDYFAAFFSKGKETLVEFRQTSLLAFHWVFSTQIRCSVNSPHVSEWANV